SRHTVSRIRAPLDTRYRRTALRGDAAMRWSLRVFQVSGIGIFIHWTFFLLLFWLAWIYYKASGDRARAALDGVLFVLAIFGCVVLHELGHALTAKRFGIKTRDITIRPIGGLARLE